MTRERWAMVLLVALVVGCVLVTLNASSRAQTAAVEGRYDVTAAATGVDAGIVTVVVLDRATGLVTIHHDYPVGGTQSYPFRNP